MTTQDVALGLPGTDAGAPFDLTPMQQAYWIGRRTGQSLGGVGCHAYLRVRRPAGRSGAAEGGITATVLKRLARQGV